MICFGKKKEARPKDGDKKSYFIYIVLIQLLIFGYINFSGFTIPGHYFELFFYSDFI